MMLPTDEIDDEETFTYKQNFHQNELNKQNFIYTLEKYKAVFSSDHIIALKLLPHYTQNGNQGTGLQQKPPEQDHQLSQTMVEGKFRFLSKSGWCVNENSAAQ